MASRGRRKSVGVVEMARDLGVSTATVSRALNGSPSLYELPAGDLPFTGAPPGSSQ